MASVGREPDGKAGAIPEAITDPKDAAPTESIHDAITAAKPASNSGISGTITTPKSTGVASH